MSSVLERDDPIAGWAARPVNTVAAADGNALTVDVEDYFQVEAFFGVIDRNDWPNRECRIERNIDRILEMFGEAHAKGTFFTLGWMAERYPEMIRRIVAEGHELASHGLAHRRADSQSRADFLDDIRRAKGILEDTGGLSVNGYRAPSFSVTRRNLWVAETLYDAGYRYSSSIYPIAHDLYGIPEAPRFAFYPLPDCDFVEIPVTAVQHLGRNWPCGGGGYFRLLPYWLSAYNMNSVRRRDRQPCMFYFHPWEIDPDQPRVPGISLRTKVRHYTNLHKMQGRLARLLRDFTWRRIDEIYPVASVSMGNA